MTSTETEIDFTPGPSTFSKCLVGFSHMTAAKVGIAITETVFCSMKVKRDAAPTALPAHLGEAKRFEKRVKSYPQSVGCHK